MDDISEQLARRDRFLRRMAMQKTPEQHLREFILFQKRAHDLLRASPHGYAHFIRRNFKARSVQAPPIDEH